MGAMLIWCICVHSFMLNKCWIEYKWGAYLQFPYVDISPILFILYCQQIYIIEHNNFTLLNKWVTVFYYKCSLSQIGHAEKWYMCLLSLEYLWHMSPDTHHTYRHWPWGQGWHNLISLYWPPVREPIKVHTLLSVIWYAKICPIGLLKGGCLTGRVKGRVSAVTFTLWCFS